MKFNYNSTKRRRTNYLNMINMSLLSSMWSSSYRSLKGSGYFHRHTRGEKNIFKTEQQTDRDNAKTNKRKIKMCSKDRMFMDEYPSIIPRKRTFIKFKMPSLFSEIKKNTTFIKIEKNSRRNSKISEQHPFFRIRPNA